MLTRRFSTRASLRLQRTACRAYFSLHALSLETGMFVRGVNKAIKRCIHSDLPERKDSYVCDFDLSMTNQVKNLSFEAMVHTLDVGVKFLLCLVQKKLPCPTVKRTHFQEDRSDNIYVYKKIVSKISYTLFEILCQSSRLVPLRNCPRSQ